jgi:hypothetical protein
MLNPSTIIFGSKIASVVGMVGTDIIGKTLTTTTKSIMNVIYHLTTTEYPNSKDIRCIIFDSDIEIKMKIIKALVDELNNNNKHVYKYVKISLDSLTEITEKIHIELNKIKEKIDYHNSLYFSSWRTLDCNYYLNNLKKYNILLDKRIDLLTKLLSINN